MNGCDDPTAVCEPLSPRISARRISRFSTKRWYASLAGFALPEREIDGNRASSPAMSYSASKGVEEGFAERRHRRNEPPRSEESRRSASDFHVIPKMDALSAVN